MIAAPAGLCALLVGLASASVMAADIPLYPTGPKEDSAYVRFVNATDSPLQLAANGSQASLILDGSDNVSKYLAVPANTPIKGTLSASGKSQALAIKVDAGEFATVIAVPDAKQGLRQIVVHEQPDDFNGLKVSLAFINADANCAEASVRPAGRTADLFKGVALGAVQRRSVNPVTLSVQLVCANANVGPALDLGELKAGGRYSVLLLPSAGGPRLISAKDSLSF